MLRHTLPTGPSGRPHPAHHVPNTLAPSTRVSRQIAPVHSGHAACVKLELWWYGPQARRTVGQNILCAASSGDVDGPTAGQQSAQPLPPAPQGAGIAGPPEPWSLDYIRNLEATWGRILGISPADRNRLLALRMKTATQGDPYAYDMVRDDTKEFMSGRIDANEFYERFMAVLGYASEITPPPTTAPSPAQIPSQQPPSTPFPTPPNATQPSAPPPTQTAPVTASTDPATAEQGQGNSQQGGPTPGVASGAQADTGSLSSVLPEAETWFKELAILIPNLPKKVELLQQCKEPEMVPHPTYRAAAHAIRAAAMAAMARQQAAAAAAAAEGGDEGEEGEDGELVERLDTSSVYEQQVDDYEDESEPSEDVKEFKGWQVLNRNKMANLVEEILRQQESQQGAQRTHTNTQASTTDPTTSTDPADTATQPAATAAASRAKKAVIVPGLEGTHFNSVVSRPARSMKGKRGGTQAVLGQAPPGAVNAVVWLRQDLRLHDNPALFEAARFANLSGGTVTLLYVHSPEEDGDRSDAGHQWRPSGAAMVWQQEALSSFNKSVISHYGPGASVVMRRGPYLQAVQEVARAVGAWHVFCNRRYEPASLEVDDAVFNSLAALGFQVQTYNAALLREPWDVKIDMRSFSGHFGTFTPFAKACEKLQRVSVPLKAPRKLPVAKESPTQACNSAADAAPVHSGSLAAPSRSDKELTVQLPQGSIYASACRCGRAWRVVPQASWRSTSEKRRAMVPSRPNDLGLYTPPRRADNTLVDWGQGIRQAWDISEAGALATLDRFFSVGLSEYERARQLADASAVSRLSPYLRFGLLSPRLVWQRMQEKQAKTVSKTFYNRLIWRDLAYWQLHHWPTMPTEPIRRHYMDVEWDWSDEGKRRLRAWQRGQTGYPLIDAGMRELWATGWMQQTLRMVCAAFLTEQLQVHWVEGAKWYHDTLVDADLAINSMMWQNAAKCGLDQWDFPLDPTGKSQDPTGAYIRKWVPELSKLPSEHLHKPWLASPQILAQSEVVIGETYPHRIVTDDAADLRSRRHVTLLQQARVLHINDWVDTRGYDLVVAPKGSSTNLDNRKVAVFTRPDLRKLPGLRDSSPSPPATTGARVDATLAEAVAQA